jgi:hypothetical protein
MGTAVDHIFFFAHVLGADHAFLRLVNMLTSLKCMIDDGLTVSTKCAIVGHILLFFKLSVKCLFLVLYTIK